MNREEVLKGTIGSGNEGFRTANSGFSSFDLK